MDFISQYRVYSSGNMSPERYHRWCALAILSMAVGRRLYVDHGYYKISPVLYITLVGRQGIRKTTAMSLARGMFLEVFPDYPVGASVMSREKIVEKMASEDCLREYTDEYGNQIEYRPIAFFINELKNFMSINPAGMVEFLTDVYDVKFFSSETIKHGLKPILHPFLTILACETPNWIIEKLKHNVIAGGFSRRMLYIYVTERPERITFPVVTEEALRAEAWCKEHLKKVERLSGGFTWTAEAREYFDVWFRGLPEQSDEILAGYYEAKDVLVQKIAMLLAAAEEHPKAILTKNLITVAIATLEEIEDNLPKLTIAAGRNELAIPQQMMMELLERNGGWVYEQIWFREGGKHFAEPEYEQAMKFFNKTGQVVRVTDPKRGRIVYEKEAFTRDVKEGKIKVDANGNGSVQ